MLKCSLSSSSSSGSYGSFKTGVVISPSTPPCDVQVSRYDDKLTVKMEFISKLLVSGLRFIVDVIWSTKAEKK